MSALFSSEVSCDWPLVMRLFRPLCSCCCRPGWTDESHAASLCSGRDASRWSQFATRRSSLPPAARSPTARCSFATARSPRSAPTCTIPAGRGRHTTPPASSSRPASSTRTRTSPTTPSTKAASSVSSMTGMEDVLDPTDINIYRDLAGGTTTANILHGSANAIGGKTRRHQAALGQDARERPRSSRARCPASSSRSARTSRASAARRPTESAALSDDAAGRRVRDPRRVHARQGVSARSGRTTRRRRRPGRTSSRRAAICSSTRWSRSSRASASSTRTAIAPTRS